MAPRTNRAMRPVDSSLLADDADIAAYRSRSATPVTVTQETASYGSDLQQAMDKALSNDESGTLTPAERYARLSASYDIWRNKGPNLDLRAEVTLMTLLVDHIRECENTVGYDGTPRVPVMGMMPCDLLNQHVRQAMQCMKLGQGKRMLPGERNTYCRENVLRDIRDTMAANCKCLNPFALAGAVRSSGLYPDFLDPKPVKPEVATTRDRINQRARGGLRVYNT